LGGAQRTLGSSVSRMSLLGGKRLCVDHTDDRLLVGPKLVDHFVEHRSCPVLRIDQSYRR
jgi:hypothetical protein